MAAATTDRPGEAHRASQAALAALVAAAVRQAFTSLLDPHDLRGSAPRVAAAIEAIVTHYGRASAAAALADYRNQRRAAGILGRFNSPLPSPPSPDVVRARVEQALSPLYGPVSPETTTRVQEALASETEQMVLGQSRTAIIEATRGDRQARGWARVTEPGACSFCRLLATRGPVYKTEQSGDFRAHTVQPNGSGGTCRCHVEPAFGVYEKTAQARQDTADYQRLADEYGHSGRDILVAWRQHVEGRPVTGPLTKPYTRSE